mmetsp:Transcript_18434/g.32850  ORF Transcript_18434/g.32850 Transcript_18434/m.32850 type:complete len:238 (+) Transcript_18434:1015-1728(+)
MGTGTLTTPPPPSPPSSNETDWTIRPVESAATITHGTLGVESSAVAALSVCVRRLPQFPYSIRPSWYTEYAPSTRPRARRTSAPLLPPNSNESPSSVPIKTGGIAPTSVRRHANLRGLAATRQGTSSAAWHTVMTSRQCSHDVSIGCISGKMRNWDDSMNTCENISSTIAEPKPSALSRVLASRAGNAGATHSGQTAAVPAARTSKSMALFVDTQRFSRTYCTLLCTAAMGSAERGK